jgi:hypothetical protein
MRKASFAILTSAFLLALWDVDVSSRRALTDVVFGMAAILCVLLVYQTSGLAAAICANLTWRLTIAGLVKRLHSALPDLRIAVGRWGPPALADESPQAILDAGANHVASLLVDSRNYLSGLLETPRIPVSDTANAYGPGAMPPTLVPGDAAHNADIGAERNDESMPATSLAHGGST